MLFTKKLKLLSVCAVFLSMTLILSSCKTEDTKPANNVPGEQVATIADQSIEDYEFKFSLAVAKEIMLADEGIEAGSDAETAFWETTVNGVKNIDKAKQNALDDMKQLKILLSMANENNVSLTEDDIKGIQESADSQVENNYGSMEAMEKEFLNKYNITYDQYISLFEMFTLQNKAYTDIVDNLEIPEEEVRQEYDNNKDFYETVTVKHVLVNYEGTEEKARTKEESEALANEILNKLNSGTEMEALVSEYSEDPGAETNKGEYTFKKTDSYVESFINWSFDANEGDTGIIESEYGYHVMQHISFQEQPFEEVKDDIEAVLKEQKFEKMLDDALADPKYDIKINQEVYDSIN